MTFKISCGKIKANLTPLCTVKHQYQSRVAASSKNYIISDYKEHEKSQIIGYNGKKTELLFPTPSF